jgi:hypothetical protein
MQTLLINDEDYQKARKLLEENGIGIANQSAMPLPVIRPSQLNPGDRPANFGGIWANDERTLASIRKKAWPKRS